MVAGMVNVFEGQEFGRPAGVAGKTGQGAAHRFDQSTRQAFMATGLDIKIERIQPFKDGLACGAMVVEHNIVR